jgi:hypothetical protein
MPGLGMWYVGKDELIRSYATKESVGDGAAQMIYTPDGRADTY